MDISSPFSHELTTIPLSAMQRGGVRRCIIEPSPSLRSREGEILSGAKESGEFM